MDALSDPVLAFWILIFSKHFLCEFVLQTNYQAQNKGIYGHPAGLLHVGITIAGTLVVLIVMPHDVSHETISWVLGLEAVVHYHQDWLKIKIGSALKTEVLSEPFWWAFGIDQYLHFLFYIFLYWYIFL